MIEYKKIISILVGVVLVVIVVNFFSIQGVFLNKGNVTQTQNLNLVAIEQHMAVGVVEKISGQEITLKNVKKMPGNSVSSGKPESVVITVNQTTVIDRLIKKDIAVIKNELANFTKIQEEAFGVPVSVLPPEPFTRIKSTISNIKIGDTLVVFSGLDIAKQTAFVVTEINIQDTVLAGISATTTPKQTTQ
jgi:hypothetical protein